MSRARVILVGGFLGAGKTTLLSAAARALSGRGIATGLVTNDQAAGLVDTALLATTGAAVSEVAGSCFCCDFDGLIGALHSLVARGATHVVAEPVGSCTDLSSTILQPIKDRHPELSLAPLTVLVDPVRVREAYGLASSSMHEDALYILRLQLQEADRVLLTKADTLTDEERELLVGVLTANLPGKPVGAVSARDPASVAAWLDSVLQEQPAGQHLVEVDYDRYAHGEAVLGWYNGELGITWRDGAAPTELLTRLLESLASQVRARGAEVGHVKALLRSGETETVANWIHVSAKPLVRSSRRPRLARDELILNARVQVAPEVLEQMVGAALETCRDLAVLERRSSACLSPARPSPTHRYLRIVSQDDAA